ncbi:MAG TPA: hypothetical protein VD929_02495 [Caulobacteraceae bacterium]|nr:hypothetical protein [Caulobacteraceae bacterium]
MRAGLTLSTSLGALLLLAGAAAAQDPTAPATTETPQALFEQVEFAPAAPLDNALPVLVIPEPAPVEAEEPAEDVLEDAALSELSGGQAITVTALTTQTLTAASTGNTVNGGTVGSGAVAIGEGAFSGYSGIGNFVVNTGHNNTLQGSIGVTVAITPGP